MWHRRHEPARALTRLSPLFESILQFVESDPHILLAGLLLLCGIGLPLPEELILVAAGFIAYRGELTGDGHHPAGLMATASIAILVGDSIPYVLGRLFGPKLLRLRLVRSWISQEGLARFDRWFQRHGRLTIFVARFLPGIRVPAFFTAGSMNTSVARFYVMDGLGVLISAPLFVWLGYYFGKDIETVVAWVQRAEHTVLWAIGGGAVVALAVYFFWWRRRRTRKLLGQPVSETTVEPSPEDTRRILAEVEGPAPAAGPDEAIGSSAAEQDRSTHAPTKSGGAAPAEPIEDSSAEAATRADETRHEPSAEERAKDAPEPGES